MGEDFRENAFLKVFSPRGIFVIFAAAALNFFTGPAFADNIVFSLNTGVPGQKVFLTGDLWQWKSSISMPEVSPGQYSASIPQPWVHQMQYKFIVNDGTKSDWRTDPNNPRTVVGDRGSCNSLLEVPFQEDPLLTADQDTPAWTQTQMKVNDLEGHERVLEVLYPAHRDPNRRLVTVYFQDGLEYLNQGSIKNIIANLSKNQSFPQVVAVLIPPKNRDEEYWLNSNYSKFVAETVVPAVEQKFEIQNNAQDRLIVGPSLGGLASIFTALQYPDVFENAASQSASFWVNTDKPGENTILTYLDEYAKRHPRDKQLKFYFEVGFFETETMNQATQQTLARARQHDIPVAFFSNPSNHDWIAWRNTTSRILLTFFGPR